ncbi:MAG: hypothetical protein A2854_03185 [Parcubacteria group bacterium RIFCSPHIGHO2_01_FULL_56_18]|nr:MAG: hypothetical protein A2854_03185 [Parcubacteria group bacterium RIFCSPHIGHO2_01_FULL_56_18]
MNSGRSRGVSSIATTAALSVAILIAASGWYVGNMMRANRALAENTSREPVQRQEYQPVEDADGNGTPDWQDELLGSGVEISTTTSSTTSPLASDPVSSIGSALIRSLVSGYASLKQYDSYTPDRGEKLANTLAASFIAPDISTAHTAEEFTIDAGSSQERLLKYRSDMRIALSGIVDIEAEPEFTLFARFIQTEDPQWLDKLSQAAQNYRVAETQMLQVNVPVGAVDIHLRVVNATATFAQTLERLVRFANDSLATMALLRTYNESEREFLLAFDALAKFYVQNVGEN